MPVFAYFCWVGAALLALLLAVDAQLPRSEPGPERPFHANIRIKSLAKGPEAVVFSGPTVDYGVRPSFEVADLSARAADPKREALAHAAPVELPKAAVRQTANAPSQRTRKRHARRAPAAPAGYQQFEAWSAPRFDVVGNFRD
jgi:hypothetical protein